MIVLWSFCRISRMRSWRVQYSVASRLHHTCRSTWLRFPQYTSQVSYSYLGKACVKSRFSSSISISDRLEKLLERMDVIWMIGQLGACASNRFSFCDQGLCVDLTIYFVISPRKSNGAGSLKIATWFLIPFDSYRHKSGLYCKTNRRTFEKFWYLQRIGNTVWVWPRHKEVG